ncbi:MAG: lipocalin family protein [Niabella sp.]
MQSILKLSVIACCFLMASCSGSKKSATTAPASRNDLKGSWVLTSTDVEGADRGKLKITSFDDAALSCFEGSEWVLPNNGYGSYTITNGTCATGARQILWSQRSGGGITYFRFKRMDGVKRSDSRKVEEGYSMEVTDYGKDYFTAKSPVNLDGQTIYIVYHFTKK